MHKELLERVMELLLKGDSAVLAALRMQFQNSAIDSIEETGAGVFVDFEVSDSSLKLELQGVKKDFVFGDVFGVIDDVFGAVGFILFVKNGYISMLEGYSNIPEGWERVDNTMELKYIGEGTRDMTEISSKWTETGKE